MSHSAAVLLCALFAVTLLGCRAADPTLRGIPRPLPGHPGNVFLTGEDVLISPPSAEGASGWTATDYDGRVIASGQGDDVLLGRLSVGHYKVSFTGEDGKPAGRTAIAVLAPLAAPTPADSPVCLDTSTAWFFGGRWGGPDQSPYAASLAALAGVNWVRDRLSWADMEPERGRFAGATVYDTTARTQADAGLKVLQILNRSPEWAHPGAGHRFPPDLRDAYRFIKAMSARWRGQVGAWEAWNEADVPIFGGHTGAEIATYQKATFWGIRDGNPDAVVCQNVLAGMEHAGLDPDFIANEAWPYFDTFNFHHYLDIDEFADYYARMRALSGGRPMWVTEAGFEAKPYPDDPEGGLTWTDQQRQARYLAQCMAVGTHEGSAATFYFILGHFIDNETQFGITHDDMSPRPAYVALAAAGRLLAGAKPIGGLRDGDLRALAFRAWPDGEERTVIVAWSRDAATPWPGLDGAQPEAAYDVLGRPLQGGSSIGTDPVYLVYAAGTLGPAAPGWEPAPAPPAWLEGEPCRVVLQALVPQERTQLAASAHLLSPDETVEVPVFVYNFGPGTVRGPLRIEAPPGLKVTAPAAEVEVAPMGRVEVTLTVSRGGPVGPDAMPVQITFDAGDGSRALLSVRFAVPLGSVPPAESLRIATADELTNWEAASSEGDRSVVRADGGGVLVEADLDEGDLWVYPALRLREGERPTARHEGIAFTLTPLGGGGDFRVMLAEAGGSTYMSSVEAWPPLRDGEPRRVVVLFERCFWGGFSAPDPNGRLDVGEIRSIGLGCNPEDRRVRFIIRDVEWVRYRD